MSLLHHYNDDEDEEMSWDEAVSYIWESSLSMNEARNRIEEYEFGDAVYVKDKYGNVKRTV